MAQGAAAGSDDRSQMISYLKAALNKDGGIRRQAEQVFQTAEQGNPVSSIPLSSPNASCVNCRSCLVQGAYYQLLSDITKDPSVDIDVRQLAGLNAKNGLDAKV